MINIVRKSGKLPDFRLILTYLQNWFLLSNFWVLTHPLNKHKKIDKVFITEYKMTAITIFSPVPSWMFIKTQRMTMSSRVAIFVGNNFSQKKKLKQNQDAVHKSKWEKCTECDHRVKSSSSLSQHIRVVHDGVKYPCRQCDQLQRGILPNTKEQFMKGWSTLAGNVTIRKLQSLVVPNTKGQFMKG